MAASGIKGRRELTVEGAHDGIYVEFESFPGIELAVKSLDPRQGKVHPELMSVKLVGSGDSAIEQATVFVPDGKLSYFVKRVEEYTQTAGEDSPKNANLLDRVSEIRVASLVGLWTDDPADFPLPDQTVWWEIWLRVRDGRERERFKAFAGSSDILIHDQSMQISDRVVLLALTTATKLSRALTVLDDLSELRRPHLVNEGLALESFSDQAEWSAHLAARLLPAEMSAPSACILDSGVHREHPLLRWSLAEEDCHAVEQHWGVHDHHGHGTEMAGLALFGDIGQALVSGGQIRLSHRLESVKILPPPPKRNDPELYGAVIARAADRVEIQSAERRRVFSMAVTAPSGLTLGENGPRYGQPTSWSASLDALSFGNTIDIDMDGNPSFIREDENPTQRLFVVSAGNVREWHVDHLTRSDLEPVEDPAQAWNVLTVGAYTERDDMSEAPVGYSGWSPLAPRGELSPHSRTSVAFSRTWPIKPEIVLEGGNLAQSPSGSLDTPENLQVLTTAAPVRNSASLTVTGMTSAATAQASNMAAQVMAEYPTLWPETVRALLVHSAEWTPVMRKRIYGESLKAKRLALLRRYGMGVPSVLRATRSASNALTLIAQDVIHPFDGASKMREMHLHNLPWPADALSALGHAEVRLRVTLSYFIDPNPGRRGWRGRYSYASHGLRFDIRRPTESNDDFRKRVNAKALAEDENRVTASADSGKWVFGVKQQQAPGSLHTDIWAGNAAELAQRGALAVYPVSGWWKESPNRDGSDAGARYALVVSIEAPEVDVDIWTPVAQQIGIPITVDI
ncbi:MULTISPECIES: S8 family peptidase [unclassified Streptomyces]|uniref:S8 family peptidase n=1 Tax=unclassified Streptomyces TaxID=2593676 RepID=UPI0018E2CF30|nr:MULTISPECIES: S8 family peptidase [unclassified Streptomyces]